ncbi:hypothetical protein [Saccharibacillus qingshengii]|uniref:hypothetical protein n=1 Tax=Saccharibacillus qingshengii TaxID=1763540 RepID=UPI0015569784|nr:hypothetical protein [Saccharibacillus qingshengii]
MKTAENHLSNSYRGSGIPLIWLEFKRLFMPKRVGLAVLVLLLGGLWLYPFRILYPGERFKDWDNAIAVQLEAEYGLQIDAAELEQFKQSLVPKIAQADAYIRSTPAFARVNLDRYDRYVKRSQMANGGTLPLNRIIDAGPAKDLFAELQASLGWIEYYENRTVNTFGLNETEKKRAADIQSRDWVSVLPPNFTNSYNSTNLLSRLALTAMLMTSLLVMHIHIGDRRVGLGEVQAASRAGTTGLFRIKMAAALLTGTLVAAVLLVALLLAYRFSGLWSLMGADINGKEGPLFWTDLSFLQYMGITYTAVFMLCWIAAGLAYMAWRKEGRRERW